MSLKFAGAAHFAFAQFAAENPGQTLTAAQISRAVIAAGFPGAASGLIPGDHAVKPDGSPANNVPACNCAKDSATALFLRTAGSDGKWRFTTRHPGASTLPEDEALNPSSGDGIRRAIDTEVAPRRSTHLEDTSIKQPNNSAAGIATKVPHSTKYDFFLSYAWEDKDFARALYRALIASGVAVWFDEAVLQLGDSLRRKIESGLVMCEYGIVIISSNFLSKEWPQRELDGLVALEIQSGRMKILPIWHEIDKAELLKRSPVLADRVAGKSEEGIQSLLKKLLAVLE